MGGGVGWGQWGVTSRTRPTYHIAHPAHGTDQRLRLVVAKLLAQVVDVHVHDVGGRIHFVLPHVLGDERSRYRLPGVADEKLEQRVFLLREVDLSTAALDASREWVDRHVTGAKSVIGGE